MDKEFVRRILAEFVNNSEDNFIKVEKALKSEVIGLKMFEQPSCFIASATDPLFEVLKSDQGMGEYFTCPKEWLPTAKTVIAIFLPFTKAVKLANSMPARAGPDCYTPSWSEEYSSLRCGGILISSTLRPPDF